MKRSALTAARKPSPDCPVSGLGKLSTTAFGELVRHEFLAAVGRDAVDGQLAAVDAVLEGASADTVANAIAKVADRHENTRVMMALAQAADQEPQLRALFRELADGTVLRVGRFLKALNPAATDADARLLHALSVGLAVVNLATGWADGERRATAVLETALRMIATRTRP
jgi:hypothetical protein